MSGFNKYFENNKKHLSLLTDDNDDVILKYNKICIIMEKLVSAEFDSQPVYQEKHIKRRLKTLEGKVITKFTDKEIPKENTHYSCITAICIDSLIKLDKENYARDNLEQCKFRLKKKRNIDLFDDKLEDSSDESESEAECIQ